MCSHQDMCTPTAWKSKLQDEVAQSSAEVEYRAVVEAAKEAMWKQNMLEDIGLSVPGPIMIQCNNQSSIRMARNHVLQAKTKHIERQCHLVRDHIKKDRIQLEFVRSKDQHANILTKPLPKVRMIVQKDMLQLIKKLRSDLLEEQ